jgi:hypothetical protein
MVLPLCEGTDGRIGSSNWDHAMQRPFLFSSDFFLTELGSSDCTVNDVGDACARDKEITSPKLAIKAQIRVQLSTQF